MKSIYLTVCLLFFSFSAFSYRLSGLILDSNRQPIPYASIYVNKTSNGVSSNIKGEYYLELQNGNYEIVFYSLGYEKKIIPITINGENEILNVTMLFSTTSLA